MYTNQSMSVRWKDSISNNFSISNAVCHNIVLSTLLFTFCIDMLLLGLGYHVGPIFAGSFGYADESH